MILLLEHGPCELLVEEFDKGAHEKGRYYGTDAGYGRYLADRITCRKE